jgi:hypothetical protein
VTRAVDIKSGDRLSLRFADGEQGATADGEAAKRKPAKADSSRQRNLL